MLLLLSACVHRPPPVVPPVPACPPDSGWNDPGPPVHVFGNTWYVGTCGLSAILITSPDGHVLIDGATAQAAPAIEANIRAAGFRVEDVRYLLGSHEHLDHAGGIAQLKEDSGAKVLARAPAAASLEHGGPVPGDPQFKSSGAFPPVVGVGRIDDGEVVELGGVEITAHATPGHTPGSTSWTWTTCEAGVCRAIAYVDSVTAISDDVYRFTDDPGVLDAFRATLTKVEAFPCDILLTPHPSASRFWDRQGNLVDAGACRAYAAKARTNLDVRVATERGIGATE